MRSALAALIALLGVGAVTAGCAYAPVPGAERTVAYSAEASAGGR
jgi:hypothetical protein